MKAIGIIIALACIAGCRVDKGNGTRIDRYIGDAGDYGELFAFKYDGCEYIAWQNTSKSGALIHTASCANPIHRRDTMEAK